MALNTNNVAREHYPIYKAAANKTADNRFELNQTATEQHSSFANILLERLFTQLGLILEGLVKLGSTVLITFFAPLRLNV